MKDYVNVDDPNLRTEFDDDSSYSTHSRGPGGGSISGDTSVKLRDYIGSKSSNPFTNAIQSGAYEYGQNVFDELTGKTAKAYQKAAVEFDAQMSMWRQQFDAQNAYNSPAAQAYRMRKAGLNPDLQNFDAGNSGASISSSPQIGDVDGITDAMQVFSSGLNFFSRIGEIFTVIFQTVDNALTNSTARRVQRESARNIAADTANKGVQKEILEQDALLKSLDYKRNLSEMTVANAVKYFGEDLYRLYNKYAPLSVSEGRVVANLADGQILPAWTTSFKSVGIYSEDEYKAMDNMLRLMMQGNSPVLLNALYEKFGDLETNREVYNKTKGSYTNAGTDKENQNLWYDLTQLEYELLSVTKKWDKRFKELFSPELQARVQNSKNVYDSEYYENLDGSTAAGYINAQNEYGTEYTRGLNPSLASGRFNSENELNKFLADYEMDVERIIDVYLQKFGRRIRNIDDDVLALPAAWAFHSVVHARSNLRAELEYLSQIINNIIPF